MTMGEIIKAHRKQLGWSQTELGAKVGVNKAAVQKWESGAVQNIKRSKIKLLADAFEISPTTLMGLEKDFNEKYMQKLAQAFSVTPDEQSYIQKYRECDDNGKELVVTVLDYEHNRSVGTIGAILKNSIPVYAQSAAAGLGNYLSGSDFEEIEFPSKNIPSGTDFGVRISGNSMQPEIPDGSIVFVRACPAILTGRIGIFSLNNEGLCKKIEVDHDHRQIRLLSVNPDYQPIEIRPEDDLRTFGQVLGFTLLS